MAGERGAGNAQQVAEASAPYASGVRRSPAGGLVMCQAHACEKSGLSGRSIQTRVLCRCEHHGAMPHAAGPRMGPPWRMASGWRSAVAGRDVCRGITHLKLRRPGTCRYSHVGGGARTGARDCSRATCRAIGAASEGVSVCGGMRRHVWRPPTPRRPPKRSKDCSVHSECRIGRPAKGHGAMGMATRLR